MNDDSGSAERPEVGDSSPTGTHEPAPPPLADFASDTHSQNGEDGILAEVLRRIGSAHTLDRWCVEFGAWDGVFLSNCARLVREDSYSAVLIEGDPRRAAKLAEAHPGRTVVPIAAFVDFAGPRRLDALLAPTPVPRDFDVLSVDIDGCDYHVWEAVRDYRPKVVVIEFNPTIPNAVEFVQARDARVNHGSSAAALVALAGAKGYTLAAATFCNLVLVADDFADAVLGSVRPDLRELRDDSSFVRYVFTGYDSTVLTSAPVPLPLLLGTNISESRLQVVPKPLRRYHGGAGPKDKVLRVITAFTSAPAATTRDVANRLRARRQRNRADG